MTDISLSQTRATLTPLAVAALALAGIAVLLLSMVAFDTRVLDGESVWLKPLKFSVSLALWLATLDWGARRLPSSVRNRRWLTIWACIAITTAFAELVWVASAAALGTRSHYNVTDPLLQTLYETAMGPIAVLLALTAAGFGASLLRHGTDVMDRAVGYAFVATTMLTIPIGMALSFAPVEGIGIAPFGWTLAPGDLRPAHFVATHLMQIIPIAMWFVALIGLERRGTSLVLTTTFSAITLLIAAYGMGWIG
ncbi:hypothetical protein [Litoreibacter roseus]|uniref:Uncharacterized protein n=1 Tax=Litoreibacter roseus TaxID=2601869 RepID=A0A6N6JL95_9RHOB|nr:hypothetical protein [Litoreibacter roseus]GFE67086.1 hypothetical protein KIN_41600 [Litoreibacter roseus]